MDLIRDQYIDTALYSYHTSIQASSQLSPSFLLYNRFPRKAIDFELDTQANSNYIMMTLEDIKKIWRNL